VLAPVAKDATCNVVAHAMEVACGALELAKISLSKGPVSPAAQPVHMCHAWCNSRVVHNAATGSKPGSPCDKHFMQNQSTLVKLIRTREGQVVCQEGSWEPGHAGYGEEPHLVPAHLTNVMREDVIHIDAISSAGLEQHVARVCHNGCRGIPLSGQRLLERRGHDRARWMTAERRHEIHERALHNSVCVTLCATACLPAVLESARGR
jgi:hypothetical protein